jgi:predicted dehydrogenase
MIQEKAMQQPLRAVLVGCGAMSEAWLSAAAALPDLTIVGLVDLHAAAAQRRAEQFALHTAVVGDDLAHTLRQTSAEIVFDCTIPEAHLQVTLTALAHGCHVLGEKPLADSLEHAQQMLAAAQAAGKLYAVIQNRRYDPNIRRMRRLVASGELGQLTTLTSDFLIGAHFGGFRDQMRHVLLLDMAIHTFDAARLLSGADPVSVYCKEWNPSGSWYAHGASAVAIFELSDGTIYTYRGSWCAEGLPTSWESDWRLVGTRGSARWDGGAGFAAEVVTSTGGFRSETAPLALPPLAAHDGVGGHAGIIAEFVRCVRSGAQPETICTDNIKSLAMVLGAIASAEQGRPVAISW